MPKELSPIDEILATDIGDAPPGGVVGEILATDIGGEPAAPRVSRGASGEWEGPMTWKDAFMSAVTNIPSSGLQYGKDIYQAVRHPVETGKAIGRLGAGIAQKAIPGEQGYEVYADQFQELMEGRYGSIDKFKRTLAKDPVGVVADVATILMPLGGAPAKVGAAIEPLNVAMRGISYAMPRSLTRLMYESAAKLGTRWPRETRLNILNMALDKRIMPTLKGLDKARNRIEELKASINTRLDQPGIAGARIPIDDLRTPLKEFVKDYELSIESGKAKRAAKIVGKEIDNLFETYAEKGRDWLTPKEMQKFKVTSHKLLNKYYKQMASQPLKISAQKQVVRAAKEAIEELVPDIKGMNWEQGVLLDLEDALKQSAQRIRQRDLFGIGAPIKTGAGTAVGHMIAGEAGARIGAGIGIVAAILDRPLVKAKLSIVLDILRRKAREPRPMRAAARLGAAQAGEMWEPE